MDHHKGVLGLAAARHPGDHADRGHGIDNGHLPLQRVPQREGDRPAAHRVQGRDPRHAEGFLPRIRARHNVVLDRYSAKDAFFKQVLDSQRNFAKDVVPYWTKILDLYSNLGNAALQKK